MFQHFSLLLEISFIRTTDWWSWSDHLLLPHNNCTNPLYKCVHHENFWILGIFTRNPNFYSWFLCMAYGQHENILIVNGKCQVNCWPLGFSWPGPAELCMHWVLATNHFLAQPGLTFTGDTETGWSGCDTCADVWWLLWLWHIIILCYFLLSLPPAHMNNTRVTTTIIGLHSWWL